jgi:hypothetical protein
LKRKRGSALQGDTLGAVPSGDFRSVDGVLQALGVADAALEHQRQAIATIRQRPALATLLLPLQPELRRRGLL